MQHDDLERLLQELGNTPVAPPDELTIARIEARWRAAAPAVDGTSAARSRAPFPRRRRRYLAQHRRPALIGSVALVAAAAGIALVIAVREPAGTEVVVAEAQGITVVLPSGEVITPLAGEELPDGSIIQSAPGSSGRVGNEVLSPGVRYIVEDGRLRPAGSLEPATTTAPGTTGVSAPDSTAAPSITRPALQPTASTAESTSTTKPSSSTSIVRRQPPVRLSVTSSRTAKGARITWAATSTPGVKRYVVVRVKSWNGTSLPKGKRLGTVNRGKATVVTDRSPVDGTFYVVAALGEKNAVLAIGSVAAPPAAPTSAPSTTKATKQPTVAPRPTTQP